MFYNSINQGIFLERPNRFIAKADINGEIVTAHVKNTGRCKELLISGAKVILQKSDNPNRKTKYDLISVWKGERLINIDSQTPNKVFAKHLKSGKYINNIKLIKPETKHGNSRFDFYVETNNRRIFIEVKGVTLEENGIVLFPDAPTERGVKHLNELSQCVKDGYEAQVVFVIQMKDVLYFTPNNKTHPAFGEALIAAEKAGVRIVAFDCEVTEDSLSIGKEIQIKLQSEI